MWFLVSKFLVNVNLRCVEFTDVHSSISVGHVPDEEDIHLTSCLMDDGHPGVAGHPVSVGCQDS